MLMGSACTGFSPDGTWRWCVKVMRYNSGMRDCFSFRTPLGSHRGLTLSGGNLGTLSPQIRLYVYGVSGWDGTAGRGPAQAGRKESIWGFPVPSIWLCCMESTPILASRSGEPDKDGRRSALPKRVSGGNRGSTRSQWGSALCPEGPDWALGHPLPSVEIMVGVCPMPMCPGHGGSIPRLGLVGGASLSCAKGPGMTQGSLSPGWGSQWGSAPCPKGPETAWGGLFPG